MLLLSSPHSVSAEKFSPATIASGLRSLLVPPSGGVVVVTRALAVASPSRGCGGGAGVQDSRDGASIIIDGDAENAKAVEEEEVMINKAEEEEEEDGGWCWVSYGRRETRRRLPPPIPSLLARRGVLRRTRTQDGRLLIRVAPVVWGECIRARRRRGRLTMQLVEHDDDESPLTLPAPAGAREEDDAVVLASDESQVDTLTPAISIGEDGVGNDFGSEGIDDDVEEAAVAARETRPVVVPPPRVPSAGCFEDVFKYRSIGGSSLHQMPGLSLRMVH